MRRSVASLFLSMCLGLGLAGTAPMAFASMTPTTTTVTVLSDPVQMGEPIELGATVVPSPVAAG